MKLSFMSSVIAVAMLVGCSSSNNKNSVILGAVIDQTGNNSELSWLQAVKLAVDQANAALALHSDLDLQFTINAQNSENDVNGGPQSRAILRIEDVVNSGAKSSVIDTTQIAEEANKPEYGFGIPLQCGSCTGGSLLNATVSVPDDPQLQAARRNVDRWLSRTTSSTAPEARVVAEMIMGSPNHGDINGDGKLKICTFGSDEAFGQSTAKSVVTEVTNIFAFTGLFGTTPRVNSSDQPAPGTDMYFESLLHPNLNDWRQIDFQGYITQLMDDQTNGVQDAYCDFITVATFARNDAAFTIDFKATPNPHGIKVIHFHTFRMSSNLLTLGDLANGEVGVSHVVLDGPAGDQFAVDFHNATGLKPAYRDSIYYDNAATLLLANIMAVHQAGSRDAATGQMVRDNLPCTSANAARLFTDRPLVHCPEGATVPVQPGVQGFKDAIAATIANQAIEYTGASGPVDYDSLGNVKDKIASYAVINGEYVDTGVFDCISSALCPCISGDCPTLVPAQ